MHHMYKVSSQAHIQTPSFVCFMAGITNTVIKNKVQHTAVLQLVCDFAYAKVLLQVTAT